MIFRAGSRYQKVEKSYGGLIMKKCGDSICKNDVGGNKKYCSDACRQRAYRCRKKGDRLNTYFYKTDRKKRSSAG